MKIYLPGEIICEEGDFIRGHGTQIEDNKLVSSYFGTPKTINKLVTVVPHMNFRYVPEVGDVVIGRVKEIYNKKWRIDMNCRAEVSLNLSAINLPGVAQRRKQESDEISMRSFFDINDLLVAEVQKVGKTGSASLHTRNEKYKKLGKGILVTMPAALVPHLKSRFITFSDLEIIVGCNGYIWVSPFNEEKDTLTRVMKIVSKLKDKIEEMEPVNFDELL
ncbi:Exosome complex component rrp4 [Nosema granulosis]|uniref:Exosome complex component rrp4 n=1 Tax=Nosema granulosis TaxID=83296 RepID=A0A9P6L053_9MICR|nr:Exosome complex component rrp4 [Nosema granulosis]